MIVEEEWKNLSSESLNGMLLVVGAPDTGKSTLARYLFERACREGKRAAFIDGDVGQALLGPPTTMTLAFGAPGDPVFPPEGKYLRSFVGSTSPSGHMLPLLVGAERLVRAARRSGAETVVFDTTGLIDPRRGGVNLKFAKIDLLRADKVFAIQRRGELRPLMEPLLRSRRVDLMELKPSEKVQSRDPNSRREHRARQYARHFSGARHLELDWTKFAVFPELDFSTNRIVALEDARGFVRSLGIVRGVDPAENRVLLLTTAESAEGIDALRIGDVELNPVDFRDRRPGSGE
jgi:polynucleotide 5'-hydroxyl-kinase GRC3/NOL9